MGIDPKKVEKRTFSHDIDASIHDEFYEIAESLPVPKHRLLEGMILAFKALPEDMQMKLLSPRPETRQMALTAIAAIGALPTEQQSLGKGAPRK